MEKENTRESEMRKPVLHHQLNVSDKDHTISRMKVTETIQEGYHGGRVLCFRESECRCKSKSVGCVFGQEAPFSCRGRCNSTEHRMCAERVSLSPDTYEETQPTPKQKSTMQWNVEDEEETDYSDSTDYDTDSDGEIKPVKNVLKVRRR